MLVATSVFPVPGGPTIIVSPGLIPDLIAVSWVGVKVAGDPAPSRKVEGREEKRVEGGRTPGVEAAKFCISWEEGLAFEGSP